MAAAAPSSAPQDIVYLDVGGAMFKTLRRTVQNYPNSLIAKMLNECPQFGRENQPIFIDHSPITFKWILEIYRNGDCEETRPSTSAAYLQRELDFYQLPSLDALGLSTSFRALSLSSKLMPKTLMQDIVAEIQESGLEDIFPWCVYIYDGLSTVADEPPQRRILVLPDAVRQTNVDPDLGFIKDRGHDAFLGAVANETFSLSSTAKDVSVLSSDASIKFTLQIPTEDLVRRVRDNAHRAGLSVELRRTGGSAGNSSFPTLPFLRLYPK